MYRFFRPLLFRLDPEQAHHLTLAALRLAGSSALFRGLLHRWFAPREMRPVQVFGINFPNPLGLAAGYDKDGTAWRGLASLGFGHVEVGTVTPRAQPGNPRPRLFRLQEDEGLVNRLGFPGRGADFVAAQLTGTRPYQVVLGVNLGKNAATPLSDAVEDYVQLLPIFSPLVDYLVINVSSPNTLGLRRLQAREALSDLLGTLNRARRELAQGQGRRLPMLVKLAPDLDDHELDDALDVIEGAQMDGVVATNTTVSRAGLRSPLAREQGGLSGVPLRAKSTRLVRQIHQRTAGRLPIIAVGGVASAADAVEKFAAGATLVQLYTGLVYRGPGIVKQILARIP